MTPFSPVLLGQLVLAAYGLTPAGSPPVLPSGLAYVDTIWGTDLFAGQVPYGLIASDSAGNLVAAIRGTDSAPEWIEDAEFLLEPCPFIPGTKTERGFTGVYLSLQAGKGGSLIVALRSYQAPSLTVTGHSLGGALATILAVDIGADRLTTFASPMIGDPAFAAAAQARVRIIEPYVNRLDIVPNLPPPFNGYQRVGPAIELDSSLGTFLSPICFHSLDTSLHMLDPAHPLAPGCAQLL